MTDDLTSRLESSARGVAMTDEVKAIHLAAIEASLERVVVPLDSRSRRRRIIAAVTAAALIGPTGLAAASDDALPGQALYGVKQVSERVTSLFDDEIVPRHRVEEAEILAAVGDSSRDEAVDRALEAVADLDEDHELRQRVAALTAADVDEGSDDSGDEPAEAVEPVERNERQSQPGDDDTSGTDADDTEDTPAQVEDEPDDDGGPAPTDDSPDDEHDDEHEDHESTDD